MRKDTKLARIRQAMRKESWDEALKLAARFQRLGEPSEAIQRAANAIQNPEFYEELGYDLGQLKAAGIAALKARYSRTPRVASRMLTNKSSGAARWLPMRSSFTIAGA